MTGVPDGSRLEAVPFGGIALYDVASLLPRDTRRERRRDPRLIEVAFVHHSGRLGRSGFAGLLASARYVTRMRDPRFPNPAYTWWLPWEPLLDRRDRLVAFRCNQDGVRSWHTGARANTVGIALGLQGNTTTDGLSESQQELLEALIPYLHDRHGELALAGHYEGEQWGGRSKPSCPGHGARQWLEAYRAAA